MIIFLYGKNDYNLKQKLSEFKKKFIKDVDPLEENINYINGETCNLSNLHTVIGTSSLFTNKKLIIIKNILANKSETVRFEFYNYLKNLKKTDDIIIFSDSTLPPQYKKNKLFKLLRKQQFVQEFVPLNDTSTKEFIKKFVSEKKGKISTTAINKLQILLKEDLWQISNNLNILINLRKDEEITISDVDNFIIGETSENIFALIDAISNKNTKLALKLFEQELEAGQSENLLFHMVIRQFKILLQISKELENKSTTKQIASKLKIHPYVAQKGSAQAKNFSTSKLKNIFSYLLDLDYQIKNSLTRPTIALELLIAKI